MGNKERYYKLWPHTTAGSAVINRLLSTITSTEGFRTDTSVLSWWLRMQPFSSFRAHEIENHLTTECWCLRKLP